MFLYYQKHLNNTVYREKNYTHDIITILREDSEKIVDSNIIHNIINNYNYTASDLNYDNMEILY